MTLLIFYTKPLLYAFKSFINHIYAFMYLLCILIICVLHILCICITFVS